MLWYRETEQKLFEILETSDAGLSKKDVLQRQKEYGLNQLAAKKDPWWHVVLEPFRNIFVVVLLVAAAVSVLSHEVLDAIIVMAIVVVNAAIFYTQHYATQRVLRSLKKHSESMVRALRDGAYAETSSVQLVPGDIIDLDEGDRVPADVRIIHTDLLQVNESALTGESVPVRKHASTLSSEKQIYEQDNMAFQGTYVVAGSAVALVVATGIRTEFGKIADLASGQQEKSPVQAKIDWLIAMLIKIVAGVSVLVFALAMLRGIPVGEAVRFVLSLAVAAVPEGLPVALTVIIVFGMRRMAKKKALVRSFKAIEDVGLITTIATDKTGTLTKNHLSVIEHWNAGAGDDVLAAVHRTIDADDAQADPLDLAIYEDIPKKGQSPSKLYAFDIGLRMSGAYYARENTLYIKGSPEHVLAASSVAKVVHHEAESVMHEMASKGFRVIAVAKISDVRTAPDTLAKLPKKPEFLGYVAFADELRPDTARAVAAAHAAGIEVKMITGDHYETAFNITKTVGIAEHPGQVIVGNALPKDDKTFAKQVREHAVFARILPEDKYRILQSLKETEITAMTGDGVNDVPALASAHVGFAMGSGNDIARDAGDIVLLRDSFSTIIDAIAEGRKIYDNIRRMLFYLLATTLGEVVTMIGALIFGLPLPLTAIQILWVNLVTDTAMVIPLGLESAEEGHMKRPPRKPGEPLLNTLLVSRMITVAVTVAIVLLSAVFVLDQAGYEASYIQTVAFMALIVAQWVNAFNARSERASAFRRIKTVNRGLGFGFFIGFVLQMLVMFGPLGHIFHIQDVSLSILLFWSILMGVAVLAVVELHKVFYPRLVKEK